MTATFEKKGTNDAIQYVYNLKGLVYYLKVCMKRF